MTTRAKTLIPYGRHSLDASDVRAVVSVLKSSRLTQGPMITRFEEAFAKYCGVPYAVAVSSGTAALHLAGLAAGFKEGDEVVTTPLSFVATANCLLYAGATPVFADIDRETLCLDRVEARAKVNPKTRGLLTVDFAGLPCLLGPQKDFSNNKNFTVIEDACHALGAQVKRAGAWRRVGDCRQSDMVVFSFHPVKHLTTGEGGMITTRRKDFYEKLLRLRSHGIERDPRRFLKTNGSGGPWYYEMQELGFNYRITDIQCALGLSQLKKVDDFVRRRQEIASIYDRSFSHVEALEILGKFPDRISSYHLYVLRFDFNKLGKSRKRVMEELARRGVGTQVHYIPVTSQPYYRKRFGYEPGDFPVTEAYYESAVSIPIYPAMTRDDVKKVVSEVERVCLKK